MGDITRNKADSWQSHETKRSSLVVPTPRTRADEAEASHKVWTMATLALANVSLKNNLHDLTLVHAPVHIPRKTVAVMIPETEEGAAVVAKCISEAVR